jgi:hypothetical protein
MIEILKPFGVGQKQRSIGRVWVVGMRALAAGDAWIEPIDALNQVFNPGSVPAKVLVVQVGEEGKPNSIAAQ